MHRLRAVRPDGSPRRRASLRVVGHTGAPARPAWSWLTVTLVVVMAMWAAGVVALPEAYRRTVDLAGASAVLVSLIAWVRRNGGALAYDQEPRALDEPLGVRLIRSRRPPLPEIGGPEIRPAGRRGSARAGRQAS
jgi:hypothetical protein